MTLDERATTRISAAFAAYITSISSNENAAMRALMLLGADALGIDLVLIANDLRATIGTPLPPGIFERLLDMLARVEHDAGMKRVVGDASCTLAQEQPGRSKLIRMDRRSVGSAASNTYTELDGEQPPLDPFGSIGFDFDDAAGS